MNLPKNSVGTRQLKNGAVTQAKLRNGAVSEAKLKNHAVTSSKVKDHSLLAKDFKTGQLPAGPRGPQGPQGPQGPTGPSNAYSRFNTAPPAFTGTTTLARLEVPAGDYVIVGKLWLTINGMGTAEAARCTVNAGSDTDTTSAHLINDGTGVSDAQAVAFNLVHSAGAAFAIDLSCSSGNSITAHNVRVTAIRVGSLANTSM